MATKKLTTSQGKGKASRPAPNANINLPGQEGWREAARHAMRRQQQGVAIAVNVPIKEDEQGYSIPSQSGKGKYSVTVNDDGSITCTCGDFEKRNKACKHVYALMATQGQDEDGELPVWAQKVTSYPAPKKKTYGQDWAAYNAAQVYEQDLFESLLHALCATIPPQPFKRGRPPIPMADMIQALCITSYSNMSGRRAMSNVRRGVSEGRLETLPSFPSVFHYLQKPELTPILVELIERSALPLKDLEVVFAADSSGFGTSVYDRHFDHKWGSEARKKNPPNKQAKFIKAHITCGVRSNIITAAIVRADRSADTVHLPSMVETTAQNFDIREFLADKAYLSRKNLRAIYLAGGTPYIPFKVNSIGHQGHHVRDALWESLYHYFQLHREEFLEHYHQRSNVESTFSMVKLKFESFVRSKTPRAQENEVLAKLLCHNLVVLVQAMFELGIAPQWEARAERESRVELEDLRMAA